MEKTFRRDTIFPRLNVNGVISFQGCTAKSGVQFFK